MNASPNLTFKQQRFIEEYQVDGNGSQAVLRAGYQTKHLAESAVQQYIKLKKKALAACDYHTSLRALSRFTIVGGDREEPR